MSHVVIAVTHCDQLPKNIKRKEQDKIWDTIMKLYLKKGKVYPTIHAVEFISCYEGKKDYSDITKLASVLYIVAHKVETTSSNLFYLQAFTFLFIIIFIPAYRANQKIKLLDQNIPKGFEDLQQMLTGNRMATCDHFEKGSHVLTWSQLKFVVWCSFLVVTILSY